MHMTDQLWSEVEISALLQAYKRYTSIDKGNLCMSYWQFVIEEVNSKRMHSKEPKTKTCVKNKIDNLKKRFRIERDGASGQIILQASGLV